MEIPFALAFTAGLVATVNPCGFAMLPAYLSYFVGLEDGELGRGDHIARALKVGAVVSAGFLTVFGLAGVLITLGVQAVIGAMPWLAMIVGVGVAALGVAMLFGFELRASLPKVNRSQDGRGVGGIFTFGVSYAIASLSCTLPVFLVVVAGTIPQLGFVSGVATFLVYGLGMSMLLIVVTLALAFGKQAIVGWLRRSAQHINRISGGILVLAGGYIVYFWVSTLSRGATAQGGFITSVEVWSSRATNTLGGAAVPIGIGLAAVIVAAVIAAVVRSRRADGGSEDPVDSTQHASDAGRGTDASSRS
ncbi:MAG: cytochrome c biogenesis protein CcdA [Nitriliruptor sp.]|nr:MAG: cytochrome c biogenesis protein CcdA [Nitriliruptor sp.]